MPVPNTPGGSRARADLTASAPLTALGRAPSKARRRPVFGRWCSRSKQGMMFCVCEGAEACQPPREARPGPTGDGALPRASTTGGSAPVFGVYDTACEAQIGLAAYSENWSGASDPRVLQKLKRAPCPPARFRTPKALQFLKQVDIHDPAMVCPRLGSGFENLGSDFVQRPRYENLFLHPHISPPPDAIVAHLKALK
jgi:hypothetical protein